jgi:DNA-binding NtrC family response regulator
MKKILVVEDEESVRFILKQMLEMGGYSVEAANNGQEALEKLKSGRFDMLVTDINMPIMNGVELFNKTREEFPGMPVIFVTAHGKDKIVIEAMKVGLADYIEKPFKMDYVLKTVQEHLMKGSK